MPKLYLIPSLLSESPWQQVLPEYNLNIIKSIHHFLVEDLRHARRFLKKLDPAINIDELQFFELNKHTTELQKNQYLELLKKGFDVGIISEAGCPGVADPGADIVKITHQKNIQVVPLIGPSSILLALMASGMNGQNFAFTGYLPVKPAERAKRISQLEKTAISFSQTMIFMETPYRNTYLLADLLKTCQPETRLCIAADITSDTEFIATRTIAEWRKQFPDLNKRPVIFLLGV